MTTPAIAIIPIDPGGPAISMFLGDGVPRVDAGGGGWETINRPKWIGFTDWIGLTPFTLTVPVLLDGFRDNTSIEGDIDALYRLLRPTPIPTTRPPILRLAGPVPYTDLTWVLNGIDHGDEVRRDDGPRTRAWITLTFLEYIPPDVSVTGRSSPAEAAAERAAASSATNDAQSSAESGTVAVAAPSGRTYTVRARDTLSSIAASQLGNYRRWPEIASMNQVRDPRLLRVGQVLRLP